MSEETRILIKIIEKSEKLLEELKKLEGYDEETKILEKVKIKLEKNLVEKVAKIIENSFEKRRGSDLMHE